MRPDHADELRTHAAVSLEGKGTELSIPEIALVLESDVSPT
jgi:hypothetical protein